jgi:hypothetical protein
VDKRRCSPRAPDGQGDDKTSNQGPCGFRCQQGAGSSFALHGADRLRAAGFDDTDVALIKAGNSYEQTSGSWGIVYVAKTGPDSYNLIAENYDGEIVTAHRGMTFKELPVWLATMDGRDGRDHQRCSTFL